MLKYVEKGVSQSRFGAVLWAIDICHPTIQHVFREEGIDWDYFGGLRLIHGMSDT